MNRKDPKWDLKSIFYQDLFEACMGLWSMEFGALIPITVNIYLNSRTSSRLATEQRN